MEPDDGSGEGRHRSGDGGPARLEAVTEDRQPLGTFTFSTPPSEMTDTELEAIADRILDQWAKELDPLESSISPQKVLRISGDDWRALATVSAPADLIPPCIDRGAFPVTGWRSRSVASGGILAVMHNP